MLAFSFEPYRIQLSRPAGNWSQSWHERAGFSITLRDAHGFVGRGEAAPLPGYSDDTLEDTALALRECRIAPLENADELESQRLRALLDEALPRATPSARFGVETALLDLLARRRGLPLHRALQLLRGDGRELGRIPLAALIPLETAAAEAALALGYSTLKLKIGRREQFAAELSALSAIRRAVGPGVRLRLDANQAFPAAFVGERLASLLAIDPEFLEEPVARGEPWPQHSPIPLALDESLRQGAELSERRSREQHLVGAVLKPGVLGGLLAALELAARAERAGLLPIVSHAFEGVVGFAAACELALALGVVSHAAGLAPHAGLGESALPAAVATAWLHPHDQPGLGLPTRTSTP
jgi:o-succinylbenzoate synthase